MAELFSLRAAVEEDRPYLDAYCWNEGMDNLPSLERVTVAANGDGESVGFIRIAFGANGVAHVNPVVVHGSWRGYGVGRALMEAATAEYGELRLVARGASVPFYRALGLEDCAWELIDTSVTENCDGCELVPECGPQPMRWAVGGGEPGAALDYDALIDSHYDDVLGRYLELT